MPLATFFLLAWKLASRRPKTQEQLMIMRGLFVIGYCVLLGATSHFEVGTLAKFPTTRPVSSS